MAKQTKSKSSTAKTTKTKPTAEPQVATPVPEFHFTKDWFSYIQSNLDYVFNDIKPKKVLEIGAFEGRSTCYFIEKCASFHQEGVEIVSVDTWQGGQEHSQIDMNAAEAAYMHNVQLQLSRFPTVKVTKIKSDSHTAMIKLLAEGGAGQFDFIYVDGSHEAPDVLFDALLAHRLVKVDGVIGFDDYLWSPDTAPNHNHYLLVKPAVDHYVNTYQQKLHVVQRLPHFYQLYVLKLAD